MNKLLLIILFTLSACSISSRQERVVKVVVKPEMSELEKDTVPGTVSDVWVEQMHDTIEVPAAIDSRGVYYRQGHTAVVQVHQGRFQKVEYPDDAVGVR